MQIILLQDLTKVGDKHDVVQVKNGFARNYLIPQGFAVIANAPNMAKLDTLKEKEAQEELAKVDVYRETATKIEGKTVKIMVKAGTSGKIFGSVNNVQVINALKEAFDVEVARKKVQLPEDIKELGTYEAVINLHPEVTAKVNLELVKD